MMENKKEKLISEILKYWKVDEKFNPEKYRNKFAHKFKNPEDAWKIDFQVGKREKQHGRVLHSANVIADIAERVYGEKSN